MVNDFLLWLEISAVACGVAYVILAAKEKISCWIFGITGSFLSIVLFLYSKLYAESLLNLYYVVMGIYGWIVWSRRSDNSERKMISTKPMVSHVLYVLFGSAISVGLYFILSSFTDAEMPLLDSFTTVFSFLATWMVAKKLLENWIYWIVIDAFSVFLYLSRDLNIYAFLMMAYTVIAISGYFTWRKNFRKQSLIV